MTGAPQPAVSRPVTVKTVRNGPLQVKGTFTLLDPEGQQYDLEGQRILLLCRCGRSKNLPFCDASHAKNGFVTADQPPTVDDGDGDGDEEGAA